jgi:hypothetical protein
MRSEKATGSDEASLNVNVDCVDKIEVGAGEQSRREVIRPPAERARAHSITLGLDVHRV